jgi:hypothetical protein
MRAVRVIVNSDPAKTPAMFGNHIERITLTPSGEHYLASGTSHFVGRSSIDGAGPPVPTERHIPFTITVASVRRQRKWE